MFATTLSSIPFAINFLAPMSIIGYILLTLGVVWLLRSSYRYLLTYVIGGMLYGLLVEVIQSGLVHTFGFSGWHGYTIALGLTWLLGAYLIYRLQLYKSANTQSSLPSDTDTLQTDRYIEHTPIYTNYTPRFPH